MLASSLIFASAAIVFVLGTAHLFYTFSGPKLRPRDPQVQKAMEQCHPGLTRQTTMWRAWIGFNASHSMGAMLFGLIYGYLAVIYPALLFNSVFLMGVGLAMLAGLAVLAVRYWFSIPRNGVFLALVCYLVGVLIGLRW